MKKSGKYPIKMRKVPWSHKRAPALDYNGVEL
jgi:hypothetical protein